MARAGLSYFAESYSGTAYAVFRILVGALFLQHGLQKLFGLFGGKAVELFSLMGMAGLIETIGGILIILGLFTKVVSLISGVEMLVAYFMSHFPNSWIPIVNKGELSLLYFTAFLVLMTRGSGKLSLDRVIFR